VVAKAEAPRVFLLYTARQRAAKPSFAPPAVAVWLIFCSSPTLLCRFFRLVWLTLAGLRS